MRKINKGALPQTSTRAYKKICEEYTLENVILEIAQNAFEHGDAPLCRISYWCDEKGISHISFFNNGKPMNDKQFQKFVSEYHCHDTTNSTPSCGGVFTSLKGYGLKDSVVFCSSDRGVSTATFKNYHKDGHATEWQWKICKTNGDNGSYDTEIKTYDYDVSEHQIGFEVLISNSKEFTETELQKAQRNIAKTFTNEAISQGKSIQLKWKDKNVSTIKLYDPMHFEKMPLADGETIYSCKTGEYVSDDIIWFVEENMFRGKNPNNGEYVDVPVRTIAAYINQPTYVKKYPKSKYFDEIGTCQAGIFPLLGQAYLEIGDNVRRHFGGSDNAGGAPRYRVCPIITNENGFLWGINSIKNSGITPFDGNHLLCEEFKKVEDDGSIGETLYDYLHETYTFLRGFHASKIRVKKGVFDYYGINGFNDKEKILSDINDFKKGIISPNNEETFCPIIVTTVADEVIYTLNKKSDIIKRINTEDGIKHYLNTEVVGVNFNEATKEDILFSVFDTLQEIGVDPSVFHRLAETLPEKIHHYED